MQLFTATTLLLASIVGSASANVTPAGITIIGGDRYQNAIGCDGQCNRLVEVPMGPSTRKLAEESTRHLAVTPVMPANGATANSELPVHFKVTGLTGTADLVFSREGCGDVVANDLVVNAAGIANEFITPTLDGCDAEGDYTWSVTHTTADGTAEEVVDGGSFTYAKLQTASSVTSPVVSSHQRTGPLRTNSGAIGGGAEVMIEEDPYVGGGDVQAAVGRIYFASAGTDFACTGTAMKDHKTGRSVIFTAAHCVYDDINGNFGSDAIFIPNRDAVVPQDANTTMEDIHRGCDDDICGCWKLSGGVVHDLWRDTPWPGRLAYDYGLYVVEDTGNHIGTECGSDALDIAVPAQEVQVGTPVEGEHITNFGYSLAYNPDFRYCAESPITRDPTPGVITLWMDNCGLTGGASGGPWMKSFDDKTGSGKIVSTNSWSLGTRTGMGGPFIEESEARCLINAARDVDIDEMMANEEGEQGIFANCFDRPCVEDEEAVRKLRRGRKLCSETNVIKKEEAKP